MREYTLNWRVFLAFAASALLALVAWAAPITEPRKTLSSANKSLAGIKRIGVVVPPPPPPMQQAELGQADLRQAVVKLLTEAGFEVVTKREQLLPILEFGLMSVSDPRFEKAAVFCLAIALRQPVDLRRFELRMYASTYHGFVVGLESREDLNKQVTTGIQSLVKQFIALHIRAERDRD